MAKRLRNAETDEKEGYVAPGQPGYEKTDRAEARRNEAEQQKAAGALQGKGVDGQGPKNEGSPDKEAIAQLLKLPLAELRDRLEAEVVRHERCFEDFTGQVCTSKPVLTPMQLHERRLFAVEVQRNEEATPDYFCHAIARLAEVEFIYPDAK